MKRPYLYLMLHTLLRHILAPLLLDIKVEGKENIPQPPFIMASNHLNWCDPVLLACLTSQVVSFMGKADLFRNPLLTFFMRSLACFPVERGQPDRQALRESLEILGKGGILGFFPEGTRSRTGNLGSFESGAAYLALKAGVPILPVGITGTYKVGILSFFIPKKHKFRIRIGPLLNGAKGTSFKKEVERLTLELEQAIRGLITD